MRTTLTLDDDVAAAARSLARQQDRSLGDVISELVRRGLEPRQGFAERSGFPVFEVAPGAPPITSEMVAKALEDLG